MEDGDWRLIKPGQEWEDGDVTSPMELELIHEDDLDEYLQVWEGAWPDSEALLSFPFRIIRRRHNYRWAS